MSDFFEPPPPSDPAPEREPRYRTPDWFGPPSGTLPGIVSVELVIVQTDAVAVCVSRIAAYPTGFEFDMVTIAGDSVEDADPLLFASDRPGFGGGSIPPEMLRFGIQFSDGSKVTSTSEPAYDRGRPSGPVMQRRGGGGGDRDWHQSLWVWPLPRSGPLEFVCEWPSQGIPVTRCAFDAQPLLDAADRAQVIFSDEDLPDWPESDGPEQNIIL